MPGFTPYPLKRIEAIRLLEQNAKSVVLLSTDVEIPGGPDGFELARTTTRRWPDISIVVASGGFKPGLGDLPQGTVFIAKPFSADVVHEHSDKNYLMAVSLNP